MRSISFLSLLAMASLASAADSDPGCANVPKDPPPARTVCEKTGYVRRPNIIATAPIASFDLCRDYCVGNPGCLSFSYAANNQSCTHYRGGILNSGFVRTPDGAVFSNRRCYQKSSTPDLSPCRIGCTNLKLDDNNCGSCDQACGITGACYGGKCYTVAIFYSDQARKYIASGPIIQGIAAAKLVETENAADRLFISDDGALRNIDTEKTALSKVADPGVEQVYNATFFGGSGPDFTVATCYPGNFVRCNFGNSEDFFVTCTPPGQPQDLRIFTGLQPEGGTDQCINIGFLGRNTSVS